jgi:hypothetical protein
LLLAVVVVVAGIWLTVRFARSATGPAWRHQIVAAATSQLGYRSDPSDTYCNKFSAYWGTGAATCGNDNLDEPWCADFAAWAWAKAHVPFVYGAQAGEINAASVSFYRWGVAHGTWHAVGSGYHPQPGDVAVYGLDIADRSAVHVAIVTGDHSGARGPDVVNGDGDRTGFSVVETGTDQYEADTKGNTGPLAGYVAPLRPSTSR